MTEVVASAAVPAVIDERPSMQARAWTFLAVLCIPAIWILAASYSGIEGDARIYIARAMADLDPNGMGRDIMFARDGQSAFTIFRPIAAALVARFDPGQAGIAFALVNLSLWFGAMVFFARCFARGRPWGLLVVCAAVLPCPYGFYPLMAAREVIAVPRPVSEAFVLIGLALVCERRAIMAFISMGVAALFHPIMALPGIAVLFVVLARGDRRWVFALAVGLIVLWGAALSGAPFLSRLTTVVDPDWLSLLRDRNPYLFIGLWHDVSLAPLTVQAITLTIGALLCDGRRREVLLIALAVGLGGVAVAFIFGDTMSLLLVLQVQPWRSLWLVSVLAMPAFGLCLLHLPRRGVLGQIALACLALGWVAFDAMPIAPVAAFSALGLFVASRTRRPIVSGRFVPAFWLVLGLACLALKWQDAWLAFSYILSMPSETIDIAPLWRLGFLPVPFICLAVIWVRWPAHRLEPPLVLLLLCLLGFWVSIGWDHRSAESKRLEADIHDPTLEAQLASKPGEVLWFLKDDEWYWLGRPQWNSFTQGSGIVFSRSLAMQWRERTAGLIALGLVNEEAMRPWRGAQGSVIPKVTKTMIEGLCTRADAPAWVVAPLMINQGLPEGVGATIWHAPVKRKIGAMLDNAIVWSVFDTYAVVPCART